MRIELNLIPEAVLLHRERAARRRILVGVPLVAVLVLASVYAGLLAQERQARRASSDIETQLVPVRSRAAQLSQLENEIEALTARRQQLQSVLGRPHDLSGLLQDLGRLIPQDVWLQSLRVEGDAVTLTGNALALRSVAQFAVTLTQAPRLDQIQVRGIQQVASGAAQVTQFEMTARLRRGAP